MNCQIIYETKKEVVYVPDKLFRDFFKFISLLKIKHKFNLRTELRIVGNQKIILASPH